MRRAITGSCPETGREQTVLVDVQQISSNGISGTKIMGYVCQYAQDCGCRTRDADTTKCPVYQKARSTIL